MPTVAPAMPVGLAELHHQPRRDHDGDKEGEHHSRAGIGGNRAHVRAHHAADKQHRQQGRHHGQSGHDGGIAHLGHRINRGLRARTAIFHRPMPGDVFDHHNRIIHQNPDGEDQRKKAHTVQRVSHDPRGKERQQNGHRNDNRHHHSLAPANRDPDQGHDGNRRQCQMEQKLIGLFVSAFAIVAGEFHSQIRRNDLALKPFDGVANLFGNGHRIGTGPLGHSQRHGRNTRVKGFPFGPRHGEHAVLLRVSFQADTRHVTHIDRSAITRGHQEIGDLIQPLQGFTGSKFNLLAVLANGAQRKGLVGPFNLSRQRLQGQPSLCQSFRIGRDANFLRLFAHQIGQANIGQRRDFHLHLTRHAG